MRPVQFRTLMRAAAVLLLLLVSLDLSNPALCALDTEKGATAGTESDHESPRAPHVDDCFCCSHCVDVTAVAAPAGLLFVTTPRVWWLPAEPFPAIYPPFHPPRA